MQLFPVRVGNILAWHFKSEIRPKGADEICYADEIRAFARMKSPLRGEVLRNFAKKEERQMAFLFFDLNYSSANWMNTGLFAGTSVIGVS